MHVEDVPQEVVALAHGDGGHEPVASEAGRLYQVEDESACG
jgi:hypothetical protein